VVFVCTMCEENLLTTFQDSLWVPTSLVKMGPTGGRNIVIVIVSHIVQNHRSQETVFISRQSLKSTLINSILIRDERNKTNGTKCELNAYKFTVSHLLTLRSKTPTKAQVQVSGHVYLC
jgi:hypothetical protein